MPLVNDIAKDLMHAMKEKSEPKLSTLRMLKSELQKLQADKGKNAEISDDDVYTIIKRLIKQRKDVAEQYSAGGANDRAESELAEIKILEPYLPAQLSDEKLTEIISQAADEIKAGSIKDMGKLMKTVMQKISGQADGSRVKNKVTEFLNKITA